MYAPVPWWSAFETSSKKPSPLHCATSTISLSSCRLRLSSGAHRACYTRDESGELSETYVGSSLELTEIEKERFRHGRWLMGEVLRQLKHLDALLQSKSAHYKNGRHQCAYLLEFPKLNNATARLLTACPAIGQRLTRLSWRTRTAKLSWSSATTRCNSSRRVSTSPCTCEECGVHVLCRPGCQLIRCNTANVSRQVRCFPPCRYMRPIAERSPRLHRLRKQRLEQARRRGCSPVRLIRQVHLAK